MKHGSMKDNRRVSLRILGKVQGVFFRASAMEEAQRLGLVGWISNLPGGEVEAVVEGSYEATESFIHWCQEGPPMASVEDLRIKSSPALDEFDTFRLLS